MNRHHSTLLPKKTKPRRPPGFALFPHDNGQWAKKVRGKLHYFGPWADPQAALDRWIAEKDYLLAGKKPRTGSGDDLTVKRLCDLFLASRERRVESGELSPRSFHDYLAIAKVVADELGKSTAVELLTPEDFADLRAKLSKGVNLKTLEGRIACTRAIFNHADKNGLLNTPLSRIWGTEFSKPSQSALSKLKHETTRLFAAAEIWRLLDSASVPMRAMILLGVNGGLGNTDVARLRFDHLDLAGGWLSLSRAKTGKPRRIPLWAETVKAIRESIERRPDPKDDRDRELVFITSARGNWIPCSKDNPPAKEFAKLRHAVGIKGRGKSFYTLRHCFQTIGDETRDFVAVSAIMGHAANSISDHYRERIGDDRLRAVVEHVRAWLLKGKPKPKPRKTRKGGAA